MRQIKRSHSSNNDPDVLKVQQKVVINEQGQITGMNKTQMVQGANMHRRGMSPKTTVIVNAGP